VFYETSKTRLVYEVCSLQRNIVDKEQPGRHVVATTDATTAAVDAFEQLGQYVEK